MKEPHRIGWYRRIILALATCVFLVFTFAYITAEFGVQGSVSPALQALRDFLLAFYPNIALIFFTFLFTLLFYSPIRDAEREKDEQRLLRQFEERLASKFDEIVVRSQLVAASIKQSGITEVGVLTPITDVLSKHMAQCQSRLLILDSWMWDDLSGLEEVFHQLALRKVPIRILLLDPDSPFAQQRSRDLRFDEQHVPNSIQGNLRSLARFRQKFHMNKLEIRCYRALPSFTLYICDNQAFVGFYFHGLTGLLGPQLQVLIKNEKQDYTLLGNYIEEEFATVWEQAKPALELENPDP